MFLYCLVVTYCEITTRFFPLADCHGPWGSTGCGLCTWLPENRQALYLFNLLWAFETGLFARLNLFIFQSSISTYYHFKGILNLVTYYVVLGRRSLLNVKILWSYWFLILDLTIDFSLIQGRDTPIHDAASQFPCRQRVFASTLSLPAAMGGRAELSDVERGALLDSSRPIQIAREACVWHQSHRSL